MLFLFNPWVLLTWVLVSWLIGLMGRNKRFGFIGNFLVSLIFSPVIGIIVLLASDDRMPPARVKRYS